MSLFGSLFGKSKRTDQSKQVDVKAIAEDLKSNDSAIRIRAIKALSNLRSDEAADALTGGLWDADLTVRIKAAKSLGKIANPRSALPLIDSIRPASLAAFMAPQTIVPTDLSNNQKRGLGEYVALVRAVAKSLELLGQNAEEPLISALTDNSPRVRGISAIVLRKIGTGKAVPALYKVLNNEREDLTIRLLVALTLDGLEKNVRHIDQLGESRLSLVSGLAIMLGGEKEYITRIEQIEQGFTTTHLVNWLKGR